MNSSSEINWGSLVFSTKITDIFLLKLQSGIQTITKPSTPLLVLVNSEVILQESVAEILKCLPDFNLTFKTFKTNEIYFHLYFQLYFQGFETGIHN
jgi:hypothetical protein